MPTLSIHSQSGSIKDLKSPLRYQNKGVSKIVYNKVLPMKPLIDTSETTRLYKQKNLLISKLSTGITFKPISKDNQVRESNDSSLDFPSRYKSSNLKSKMSQESFQILNNLVYRQEVLKEMKARGQKQLPENLARYTKSHHSTSKSMNVICQPAPLPKADHYFSGSLTVAKVNMKVAP